MLIHGLRVRPAHRDILHRLVHVGGVGEVSLVVGRAGCSALATGNAPKQRADSQEVIWYD